MNRMEIADKFFTVAWGKLPGGNPLQDEQAVKDFGKNILRAYEALSETDKAKADAVWQKWMGKANEASVALPYQTPAERFNGNFPSFDFEESDIIINHTLANAIAQKNPTLLLTGGGTGSGKSTLLSKLIKEEMPHAVLLDPDEGVLENHGPYLWARAVLKMALGKPVAPGASVEEIIAQRNEWRLPAYDIFRAASNAINTEIASEVVAKGYDAAFGFTDIKGDGFAVQLPAYKQAGYKLDYVAVFARLDVRNALENYRERPADPADRVNKVRDFIGALPDYLELCDRTRFYIADHGHQFTQVATSEKGKDVVLNHSPSMAAIYDMMLVEQTRAVVSDKPEMGKAIGDSFRFLIETFEAPHVAAAYREPVVPPSILKH